MACRTVILLLVSSCLMPSSGGLVYYITPDQSDSCVVNKTRLSPCYSFQKLIEDKVWESLKYDSMDLVFLPGTHSVLQNHSFNVSNLKSVSIRPWTEEQKVVMKCDENGSPLTLYNVADFSLSAIDFVFCSIQYRYKYNTSRMRSIDIKRCVFEKGKKAVVINSTSPTLNISISNCFFASGNGTALATLIPMAHNFNKLAQLTISDTTFQDNWSGPGSVVTTEFTHLTICSSHFVHNQAGAILSNHSNLNILDSFFVDNHAKLFGGAIFLQDGNLAVENCQFINNTAEISGGAMELQGGTLSTASLTLRNSIVQGNTAEFAGGAFTLKSVVVSIFDTHFEDNLALVGGALYLEGGTKNFEAINCTFYSNKATSSGGAIYCKNSNNVSIAGGWSASNQAPTGLGGFIVLSNCQFSTLRYWYNISNNEAFGGGAIYAEDSSSIIFVEGGQLADNVAEASGGALYLENSYLNLSDVPISLQNNHANFEGGAIFVSDQECEDFYPQCFLSDHSENKDAKINFTGNTAFQGGAVLYGGLLDRCCFDKTKSIPTICKTRGVDAIESIFEYDPSPLAITSDPVKVCLCTSDLKLDCGTRELTLSKMRGQAVRILGSVVDETNSPRASFMRARYSDSMGILGEGEGGVTTDSGCRNLSYHIFTVSNSATLLLQPEGNCERSENSRLTLNIEILPCSVGFENHKDRCVCERRLYDLFGDEMRCDIDSNTIRMKDTIWLEYDDRHLKVRPSCPLDYCRADSDAIYLARPADEQCANNRSGVLCGSCRANFSIALGGSKCLQCSSSYAVIWLIPVFAVAGIALVAFLLVLNLIVSHGTLNGLIFYANVLTIAGLTNIRSCNINLALSVFIAWINLDLGVETCFYSGMDTYQKTWLQFAFPLYIWFLVIAITIASHYSANAMKVFGRNNIAILATLLLLSYTKILKTIVTALDFTNVLQGDAGNTSDPLVSYKVWTHDGSLEYLKGRHVLLFIVSLVLLILLFFPYTLLLTFGQCLRSLKTKRRCVQRIIHSTAFVSIMDAYHAPYTKRHRYWTGFMLITRCGLFLLFSFNYSDNPLVVNMFITNLTTIGVLALKICAGKMYKNFYVSLLELSFLINLSILSGTLYFLGTDNGYPDGTACKCINASISISLVIFVGMLIYHAYLQLKKIKRFNSLNNSILTKVRPPSVVSYREIDEVVQHEPVQHEQSFPTSSTVELREELLESNNECDTY